MDRKRGGGGGGGTCKGWNGMGVCQLSIHGHIDIGRYLLWTGEDRKTDYDTNDVLDAMSLFLSS
jgi:hypothetical protein